MTNDNNNEPKSGCVECPCCSDPHMVSDWLQAEYCDECLSAGCDVHEYDPQCSAALEDWT